MGYHIMTHPSVVQRLDYAITANAAGEGTMALEAYGILIGIHIDYGTTSATTDVEVYEELPANAKRGLLTVNNANTSGYFAVQRAAVSTANVATGGYEVMPVAGRIVVRITGAGSGGVVRVYPYIVSA
jgi:hypothetical protein